MCVCPPVRLTGYLSVSVPCDPFLMLLKILEILKGLGILEICQLLEILEVLEIPEALGLKP